MTTIGVLGGGQLGRMLGLAAIPLGMQCRFLDPSPQACAASVGELFVGTFDDHELLTEFAQECEVVTFEWEGIPSEAAAFVQGIVPVHPNDRALQASQDRWDEKQLFKSLDIPTPEFCNMENRRVEDIVNELGTPCVIKTRQGGYDGKGQIVIKEQSQFADAQKLVDQQPCIAESWVPFDRELSIIGVRSSTGETRFYPLIENHHENGVLSWSLAPAPQVSQKLQQTAETYVSAIMERLDYVGVLALELFNVQEQLIANEMAPRVHNSGHWTIEGAFTSQFENHLRAICGLPLGDTNARGQSIMVNLLGEIPKSEDLFQVPGAHLHDYGKTARPGRKVGHVTVTDLADNEVQPTLARLLSLCNREV